MWDPQPGPQTQAILTAKFVDELNFGGARGGGKSDFLLGDFGQDVGKGFGSSWRGVLFRRTYPELEELIARSRELYPPWFPGADWSEQAKTWKFPDGATLKMRFLERDADADRYQGHQYTWIGWDELGNWPSLASYKKLKATLRSAHGVDVKRIRASSNPGGPGHAAVKQYFGIDRHPMGGVPIVEEETGMSRMFIRSRLEDNRILVESDPGYRGRIMSSGPPALVRAWLDGDWDVTLGAFFEEWRADYHIIEPIKLPDHWMRFRSMDWGYASPFSVGWWAVASEDFDAGKSWPIPKGSLIRYREWYGTTGPNEGLRLTANEVAQGIREREQDDDICYGVLDPSAFAQDGGPSHAERMAECGVVFKRADNRKIAREGALGGWDVMRQRLKGMDGVPMLYVFSTCHDLIRTIPAIQHHDVRPEDIADNLEDHAVDEVRYACMSRPWTAKMPVAAEVSPKRPHLMTLDEMLLIERRREASYERI